MHNDMQNHKIILDYVSVCSDIEGILDEIRVLRSEKLFSKAVGENAIQKLKDYDNAIRKRLHDAFQIVVIGDFKRGKSTLINSILGESILPTAVTPETVTINKISFSEIPKAEAILKNGKRTKLSLEELGRDSIKQIINQLPAQIDHIDIRINNEILKEISIIDTPGIGDLLKSFDKQVSEYLVNADALIYVITARAPLSLSEQAFISSAVIPQNFSRVFMVVNMADTLENEDDVNKIKELTLERARNISPNIAAYVLSALDELCRKNNLKRPNMQLSDILERNYQDFETALQNDIILQRDVVKSMRGISISQIMLNDISARINLIKKSLLSNIGNLKDNESEFQTHNSELISSIEGHKSSMSMDIENMKAEACHWIYEFMDKMKDEIKSINSAINMGDIQRHLQFYLMDMIKNAIILCIERHQKEIEDHLSASSKAIAHEVTSHAFGSINAQIADNITDISWTNVDSAMFMGNILGNVLGVSSILGPLQLVGQAIAGFIRQKVISNKQNDFLSQILQEFDIIIQDVIKGINTIYDDLKRNAVGKIDEIYQSQVEASLEAMHQAKQIVIDEDTRVEEMIDYLDDVLKNIDLFRERLMKYN